jgi:hypothetical protein
METRQISVELTKQVYVVIVNSDLTEGRGRPRILHVCDNKATAIRLGKGKDVQGSNAIIETDTAYKIDRRWYVRGKIETPTKQDIEESNRLSKLDTIVDKAKKAGLTTEEILLLRSNMPAN